MSPSNNDSDQALAAGKKPDQIKDADDLAIDALSQASAGQASAKSDGSLSEADKSDEFAQTLHSLESVIESKANKVMALKQEMKEKKQMVKNVYENDEQYQEATEARQEATQVYKQRRSDLEDTTQVRSLREDIRSLKDDLKDVEESLSNHLINYHQLTNSTSFDTSDGDQWEFKIKAKVKNKKR